MSPQNAAPAATPTAAPAREAAATRWAAAAILTSLLLGALAALPSARGTPYLRGDSPYYLVTAFSLLADRDLDLSNQLPHGVEAHSGQVARDRRGRFVPKHPVLMPVVALPFIAAMGPPGALVFNLAQATLVLWLLFRLCLRVAQPALSAAAVTLAAIGSFWPQYLWNFSPDLFATALALGALAVLPDSRLPSAGRAGLVGLLWGAAIWAKAPFVVPAAVALAVSAPRLRGSWFPLLAGLAAPLACLAVLDAWLFGAPWVTAYDRIAVHADGAWQTVSQRADFALPLAEGLRGQLLDRAHGLLWTSPAALVAIAGLPSLYRRHRRLALIVALSSAGLLGLFAKYRLWDASHYGNRFLFLPVMLAALPLAAALAALLARLRGQRSPRAS